MANEFLELLNQLGGWDGFEVADLAEHGMGEDMFGFPAPGADHVAGPAGASEAL